MIDDTDKYLGDDDVVEATATPIREEAPPPEAQAAPAPRPQVAPGGGVIPAPARTAGEVIDLLEDGNLSADLHAELRDLASQMRAVHNSTGGKVKGEATLVLKLELDSDEAFRVEGKIKVKAPDLPRRRSIMWEDGGAFTRFPPNQTQMFGSAPIRRIG